MILNNLLLLMKKTTILTGFLGAGKTTYLNHLLKSNPNTKYAIIENEFGEQSIDGDLIVRATDNIVEMNNGCLCCSLNEGLYDLLSDLHLRKDDFDELIIEATGIADPAGIAEPFLTNPAVKNTFKLINTICMIDAEQIEDQLQETEEAIKQISFSDVLLINKSDLVSVDYIDSLKKILNGINPLAEILVKENGDYPVIYSNKSNQQKSHIENSQKCNHHNHGSHDNQHEHKGLSTFSHQHTNIVTHSFVFNQPFDIELLYHRLFVLLTVQGKDIYRFKAIVYSKNTPYKLVIQSVGKRLGMEELNAWKEEEEKHSRFVFIGKAIKPEGFRKLLAQCVSKDKFHTINTSKPTS
jgi:G3E family GTPase